MTEQEEQHAGKQEKETPFTDKEIAEFREVFDLMDKDKGGTLNADEIKQLMDMLGMKIRHDELMAIVQEVDTDGSGQVDFHEFLEVMARPMQLSYTRRDIMRAFRMFVTPNTPAGCIHPEALEQALLKYCGDKVPQEEVLRLVNSLEVNADGFIDFESKVNIFVPNKCEPLLICEDDSQRQLHKTEHVMTEIPEPKISCGKTKQGGGCPSRSMPARVSSWLESRIWRRRTLRWFSAGPHRHDH